MIKLLDLKVIDCGEASSSSGTGNKKTAVMHLSAKLFYNFNKITYECQLMSMHSLNKRATQYSGSHNFIAPHIFLEIMVIIQILKNPSYPIDFD